MRTRTARTTELVNRRSIQYASVRFSHQFAGAVRRGIIQTCSSFPTGAMTSLTGSDTLLLHRVPTAIAGAPGLASGTLMRVAILDTETTGLAQDTDTIIELAILVLDVDTATGLPVREVIRYEGLEDCEGDLSADVVRVTGITKDMLAGKRLDDAAVSDALSGVDLVIAHNASFDRKFVERRYPQTVTMNWACSIEDVEWDKLGIESNKLDYIAFKCGYFFDAHRAIADCLAVACVLAAELNGGSPAMLRLLRAAGEPSFSLWARRSPFETKDALKARGYRWDAEAKCWHTNVRGTQSARDEWKWLKTEIYRGATPATETFVLTARDRYSERTGERAERGGD